MKEWNAVSALNGKDGPFYLQLKNRIKYEICNGTLKPGDQIPTEPELQAQYGVSRITVRKAIQELAGEGYVTKAQGIGTFVNRPEQYFDSRLAISFTEAYEKRGYTVSSRVLFVGMQDATEEQRKFLKLDADEQVLRMTRVRCVDGIPLVYETNFFASQYAGLAKYDLSGSLFRILIDRFHAMPGNKSGGTLAVVTPPEDVLQALEMPKHYPVLAQSRGVEDIFDRPLYMIDEFIRTDIPDLYKQYL